MHIFICSLSPHLSLLLLLVNSYVLLVDIFRSNANLSVCLSVTVILQDIWEREKAKLSVATQAFVASQSAAATAAANVPNKQIDRFVYTTGSE